MSGVRIESGTRTLPRSAGASSSSSRSERALVEGEGVGPEAAAVEKWAPRDRAGAAVGALEEEGEGEVSAAKSEFAASEMRSEARFWLFVNLRGDDP